MRCAHALVLMVILSPWAIADDRESDRPGTNKPGDHSGACYTIANPDLRNLCRARVSSDASTCYTIMDPDQRAYCRALISGGSRR